MDDLDRLAYMLDQAIREARELPVPECRIGDALLVLAVATLLDDAYTVGEIRRRVVEIAEVVRE